MLMDAVHRRNKATINRLRARPGDCPDLNRELFEGIATDKLDQLPWLLEAGADPNGSYGDACFPPLALAYMKRAFSYHGTKVPMADRSTAALALLLKQGADPNLQWATGCGGVSSPLWTGVKGLTPTMIAAVAGDIEFVTLLVDAGANVSARDSKGRTAVFYARASHQPSAPEIVALLSR
jgi:ankyrin repeat protein